MSCTSVPPAATFSICTPRQMAKMGRSQARAAAMRDISNSSRGGSTSPSFSCGASPYLAGSTSPPPRRLEHERPEFARLRGQFVGGHAVKRAEDIRIGQPFALAQLVEDIVGADDGVLKIRSRFSLEAERLLDVEHD